MMAWMAELGNEDWQELSPEQRLERLEERVKLVEERIKAMEDQKQCDGPHTSPANQ